LLHRFGGLVRPILGLVGPKMDIKTHKKKHTIEMLRNLEKTHGLWPDLFQSLATFVDLWRKGSSLSWGYVFLQLEDITIAVLNVNQ
jgi:hypothetical protein